MPIPAYLLLAHGMLDDATSGLITAFNIVEAIEAKPVSGLPKTKDGITILRWSPLYVIATWMIDQKAGESRRDVFEHEVRMLLPDPEAEEETQILSVVADEFSFREAPEKPLYRLTVGLQSPVPLAGPGLMWVESRTRKKGAPEWIVQRYPVVVKHVLRSSSDAPAG